MAQMVFHMLDELLGNAIVLQAVIDSFNHEDVRTLVVTAHVIDITNLSTIGHHIDGLAVIERST